jgi:sulfonate dioxygenase
MAPSAIETSTVTERRNVNPTVKLTGGIGPYKELSPIGYEKEAEETGRDGFEPAKVSHILPLPIPFTALR